MLPFLQFQAQLRVLHWQTKQYPRHVAYGQTYETLDGLIDSFVETYSGVYGRPAFNGSITLENVEGFKLSAYLTDFIEYLKNFDNECKDHTDLLNIRDEMLGTVNKLRYLLTLK